MIPTMSCWMRSFVGGTNVLERASRMGRAWCETSRKARNSCAKASSIRGAERAFTGKYSGGRSEVVPEREGVEQEGRGEREGKTHVQ